MSTSIAQAFKKLNVSSVSEDHVNIFEVSYQYLSNVKKFNDVKSFNNCLVALINLDKYDKALELIKKVKSEELIQQFSIEVGYIYYKTKQSQLLQELYQRILSRDSTSKFMIRGLKHIVAQDYYQKGEDKQALELYQDLIKENDEIDNSLDLYTNELAIISQLNFSSHELKEPLSSTDEQNHDLVFNQALISLSENKATLALSQLDKALELLGYLKLDDESYQIEKCPIVLFKAYIYQTEGQKEEALKLLEDLKLNKFNDIMINLIINNNYYAINEVLVDQTGSDRNVNLAQRVLNYQQNLAITARKLNHGQYTTLIQNNILLKYLTNSLTVKSNQLSSFNLSKLVSKGNFSLLSFKVLIKLGITNEDLISSPRVVSKKLFKAINKSEITEANFNELVACALILLSIDSVSGNYNRSVISLEKLTEFNFKQLSKLLPGLIGSLVNLYETVDATEKLNKLYNTLIQTLDNASSLSHVDFNFFKVIGFKLLIVNDERYNTVFTKLNQANSEDVLIKNVLHNSSEHLLPVETLVSSVDDDIVNTDIDSLIPVSQVSKSSSSSSKVEKKRTKKARFGPSKVLKPADQINLDQERWLPLKLRSNYKPKKSKKKVSTHQGAIESAGASQVSTPSSTPAPTMSNESSAGSSKKANKKKKKGKK
ncbi:Signal recognition particle subunit SRP72 [Yamadazyma tenuis]|uniref:Signal recognition particle subunit SRP72 n=1 Tax=Candida tenuis (strain ATCC 10573 / BCRC 21748 / CBS 615 / JCM 9827 / NBRC 10315 / NRRL Y-1498 / VKM Y-70) TaxID=590646 RepID=G3BA08_CANTC|nr:uncharacterized protein CANTEDRAFT_94868 [Yamadazyma tenuis ATCC 10573]EGV61982.1 hypothetical protein CANTEDRAFT_94868 [Yamadazyma tenuis ATCC 10573]WEJ93234.1 Signal recognition particle subunit SRP72 [Yamadazyma tenuis]